MRFWPAFSSRPGRRRNGLEAPASLAEPFARSPPPGRVDKSVPAETEDPVWGHFKGEDANFAISRAGAGVGVEGAVTDPVAPPFPILRGVGVRDAKQFGVVAHHHGLALDHEVEPLAERIGAGGEGDFP